MSLELIVLRLLHVLGAIVWVGSGLFTYLFLLPSLKPGSATFGEVMGGLQRRHLFTVLPLTALITMLSGVRLLMIVSDGFSAEYFARLGGQVYAAAGLASVVAFVTSLLVSRPAAVRTGTLMAQRPAAQSDAERARIDAEVAVLRRRGAVATGVSMTLIILSAAGMAVARYL
jgi:uncharacterized membrane protein